MCPNRVVALLVPEPLGQDSARAGAHNRHIMRSRTMRAGACGTGDTATIGLGDPWPP